MSSLTDSLKMAKESFFLGNNQSDKNQSPVVWDGLGLSNEYSGIGSYGAYLYMALKQLGMQLAIVASPGSKLSYADASHILFTSKNFRHQTWRKILQLKPIFPILGYRRAKQEFSSLIYHGLSNINLPCFGEIRPSDKLLITIHDIIPLLTNQKSALALQMLWLLPRVLDRADYVVTGSNWAKDTLLERFGSKYATKISALGYGTQRFEHHAASSNVQKISDQLLPLGKLDLPGLKFHDSKIDGLTIARGESYKRLEIVEHIAKRNQDLSFAVVTDEVGRKLLAAAPSNLTCHVHLTDNQLEQLSSFAKVVVQPSLFEGWCLPAAHGLQRGQHVLYCRGTGVDEVAAHCPEQATGMPRNSTPEDWSQSFRDIVQRINPPSKHIVMQTWEEVAKKTQRIYQQLL
ncbi:MAG: hypothetical protein NTV34_02475 [Proteobacteria bacterium]|nr:hypothetical protein [Pseudomonadota bacterium]